ncbi:hypothetical protein [Burkholderia vietnamiensis]|uniref:hypothetical protein n=1 Tax=Burkholderia vietnamiensis TaxID=60552 RepID=UPI000AAF0AB6|nr:hypothetical protein [Burkholderia vietnamiensis]
MLTREDVVWCYKTFLNRDPESVEVVDGWLERCQDFRQLAHAFEESTEHQKLLIKPAAAAPVEANPQGWIPYVPRPPFNGAHGEFLPFSMCVADDFMHPRFMEICDAIKHRFQFHRKLWEWVFVTHHLLESGAVKSGARGLVFGVGAERLPAYFASLGASIVATDAPQEIGEANGWSATGQHSAELENLLYRDLIDEDGFRRLVSYEHCDMNHIPDHLTGFDFNWSSCCFEHLGDLDAGMDFVVNAVEKTLRVGGVAVHTTELNMSSDDETLASGHTVIYRRRDLRALVERLRDRGHEVEELRFSHGSHPLDFHVDMPPYRHDPHIKLMYDRFVVTSVGIVVRRGR